MIFDLAYEKKKKWLDKGLHTLIVFFFFLPDFIPAEHKIPIAVSAWLASIVGFGVGEALADKLQLKISDKRK